MTFEIQIFELCKPGKVLAYYYLKFECVKDAKDFAHSILEENQGFCISQTEHNKFCKT